MNLSKPNLSRILGSAIVFAIFAAGCGGSNTAFTRLPAAQLEGANLLAQSTQKLFVGNTAGSISVYSTGSSPTILQTITNGIAVPGGLWVDPNDTLYAVNLPGKSSQTSL